MIEYGESNYGKVERLKRLKTRIYEELPKLCLLIKCTAAFWEESKQTYAVVDIPPRSYTLFK